MKKNYLVKIIIAALVFILLNSYVVSAGHDDFDPMYFDENNQLSFETVDNVAIKTAYKTIGWIFKKYDLPKDDSDNLYVTCTLNDESYVGDDDKAHTFFYVNRDDVLDRIAEVSEAWAEELRTIGGEVYLDSVMTIRQNGELQGELYEDGSYSGEVYDTYDGISNARYWRNPTDLMQYYDRTVVISADPDEYTPRDDEQKVENLVSTLNYSVSAPDIVKECSLTNKEFDVQEAIPSSEQVNATGIFSKYAYILKYQKISGRKTYAVRVNVRTQLYWTDRDGDERTEEVLYAKWYYVDRKYCYYKVMDFQLYQMTRWNFSNLAIGDFMVEYDADLSVYENNNAFMEDAEYVSELYIDEGTIYGDSNYRPTVTIKEYTEAASECVGSIQTDSDAIFINDEEILGNQGANLPVHNENVTLTKNNLEIEKMNKNGNHISTSECTYTNYFDPDKQYTISVGINNIIVHTPVICTATINNNKTDNKLEIGKTFYVNVQNTGQHTGRRGYGWRDYSRYVECNQAKFPFDVIQSGKLIKKDTWITIKTSYTENTFSLPDKILIGQYDIEFRTLALNYDENRYDYKHKYLNELFVNYSAYANQMIEIVGPTGERDVKNYRIVGTH